MPTLSHFLIMPPKRGDLSKTTINKMMNDYHMGFTDEELLKINKNWLVDVAAEVGFITPEQRGASMDKEIIVRKRYLRTLVDDDAVIGMLDVYVKLASRVRAAGSKVVNLFAMSAFDSGLFDGDAADQFIKDTLLDQTFIKYCMLPFKADIGRSAAAEAVMPAPLRPIWAQYANLLRPMYPSNDELSSTFPWDQPLTDMAREYIGALSSHVMTHLSNRLTAHVRRVLKEDFNVSVRHDDALGRTMGHMPLQSTTGAGTGAAVAHPPFFMSDVYAALDCNAAPGRPLPPAIEEFVGGLRAQLGLQGSKRISKLTKLTAAAFRLHFQLSRGRGKPTFSACPVVKTHRTFAYLDERMMASRMPKTQSETTPAASAMATLLHLTPAEWTAANKAARRSHRNAAKGRPQKKRCGYGSAGWREADGWSVTSAATDGVALCVTLTRVRSCSEQYNPPPEEEGDGACTRRIAAFAARQGVGVDGLHLADHDPGRSNLFQAVQKRADGSFASSRLTRSSYHSRNLEKQRKAAEVARRAARPELLAALAMLSEGTWRTTDRGEFVNMLELQGSVNELLVEEYVEDDWYARWKMRLWRRRRSVLMQSYAAVLKVAPKG